MSASTRLTVLAIILISGLALFVLGGDMIVNSSQYWIIPTGLCPILGQILMVLAFMMTFGIIAFMLGIGQTKPEEHDGLSLPPFDTIVPVPPDPAGERIIDTRFVSLETPETRVERPLSASDHEETLPHLVGLTGGLPARTKIPKGVFTIGRGAECDLVLSSQLVSRRHAQLEWTGEELLIHDLGSSNKTRVNDKVLEREVALQDGDVIQIVDYHLEIELPASLSQTILLPRDQQEPSETINLPREEKEEEEERL